jgi:hypothetical protein
MQIGYLDPASGSILASALVGGAAAMGVAAKSARSRIAGKFKRKSTDEPVTAATADEDITAEDVVTTDAPVESKTDA